MPVIINDFEVIVDDAAPAQTSQAEAAPPPDFSPETIEHILRFFRERRARLLAD
jgi:hypothetical protein